MDMILVVVAIIVTFLVFTWLVKVVKATIGTAIAIALLILVVQLLFGIGPVQVWQQVSQVFQSVWQTVMGGR